MSFGGGGGGTQQVVQSNIPEEFYPQVRGLLDAAGRELFSGYEQGDGTFNITGPKPFSPYSTEAYRQAGLPSGADYVAGLGSGQRRALDIANWLGGENDGQRYINDMYGNAEAFATSGGRGAQDIARLAGEYGRSGAGYGEAAAGLAPTAQQAGLAAANLGLQATGATGKEGERGLGLGVGEEARGFARHAAGMGGLYEQMATSPETFQKYMSPYMQGVVDVEQKQAQRQADIAAQGRKAAAVRAGAFGGSRQAIEDAEANRALQDQLQGIQSRGLQQAYQQAQGNILNRAQLGLQGLAGAQQGLGTSLQGGQLGLGALGQAMAGQQAHLQGLGQAGQLYGLGMQGAGVGLQGGQLGLGAYGQAGEAGTRLADIAGRRLGDVMSTAQFQYGMGEQERQLEQQRINQQIQNWAMRQEMPFQRLSQFSALLRGYAPPGQTTTQYQAAPSGLSQLAGLGMAGAGLYGMGRKAGGVIKDESGIDRLALRKALAGD